MPAFFSPQKVLRVTELFVPGLPGWLACEEHKPLAGAGVGFVDFAAWAAELVGHVAYDLLEAKIKNKNCTSSTICTERFFETN